jgi:N-acetylmuramoyl-L-alanine amidase
MRWSRKTRSKNTRMASRRSTSARLLLSLIAMVVAGSALLLSGSPDEKHISIYSNLADYSLPVVEHNGVGYIGLLEALEPLGTVSAKTNGGHWKLRYNDAESEFTAGKTRARVRGRDLDLPASFLLENGRGLVPLSGLNTLLPQILGGPVTFHESARRLFIGNVAVHFTAQVSMTNPPQLVMNFTAPVNPMIATEPGKLRMVFTHEPLMAPGSQSLTFDSKIIPSASFEENDGAAEVVVTGSVPLLASFINDGRTIIVGPPQTVAAPVTPAAQTAASPSAAPPAAGGTAVPGTRGYVVVIDASHGGDERGAALSDQLAEKDVTLAFARRLRLELGARGVTALLLRDADTRLSLDQRASMTNAARPAIYLCLHAASQGNGIRLYTSLLPAGAENRGPFLDWNTAQTAFQTGSQTVEASLMTETQNRRVPVRTSLAPLRPLNNITAAAVAIEVSPLTSDISQLNSPDYQQLIAAAVAAGIASARDKLETMP